MRDQNRIKPYCDTLAEMWQKVPDLRFSQFMIDVLRQYFTEHGHDAFYVEDDEFFAYLKEYVERIAGK